MRTISNMIIFAMAVYAALDIFVAAPSRLVTTVPVQAQYMVASR